MQIGEFAAAINDRDVYIDKLETNLRDCISQRDDLAKDAEVQSLNFTKEIETLRQQLKESRNLLERQKERKDVNLVEQIELKNKVC